MSENVRLASIGLGWWGGVLADGVADSGQGKVVACFARTKENRESFAEARGITAAESFESILADDGIDGVIIATAHQSHLPLIQAAATAGKHIFIDKPLTLTPADCRAAIEAAAAGGVLLQTGHQRRRMTANRMIKAMIDGGDLGDIETIETHHSFRTVTRCPIRLGGGTPNRARWEA